MEIASKASGGDIVYVFSYAGSARHLRVLQVDAGVEFALHYSVIEQSGATRRIILAPIVAFAQGPFETVAMHRADAYGKLVAARDTLPALAAAAIAGLR